jgi:hypothetical protein
LSWLPNPLQHKDQSQGIRQPVPRTNNDSGTSPDRGASPPVQSRTFHKVYGVTEMATWQRVLLA